MSNKKSKTQIILSMLQSKPMKVDKDDSESGGSDAGPQCDTYANVIRDLAGTPDPEHLEKFEREHIDAHKQHDATKDSKASSKSSKVKSQDFEENQAKEVEKRSEQEKQPTPSAQPFKGPSGPRR